MICIHISFFVIVLLGAEAFGCDGTMRIPARFVAKCAGLLFSLPIVCQADTFKQNTFAQFLTSLDHGDVSKVTFLGINAKSIIVEYKSGDLSRIGEAEGFPAFEDPLSPSGPTQVIAR